MARGGIFVVVSREVVLLLGFEFSVSGVGFRGLRRMACRLLRVAVRGVRLLELEALERTWKVFLCAVSRRVLL